MEGQGSPDVHKPPQKTEQEGWLLNSVYEAEIILIPKNENGVMKNVKANIPHNTHINNSQ